MDRYRSAALSALCTTMLSSTFLATPPGLRLAGLVSGGLETAAASEVRSLPASGWEPVAEYQVAQALGEIPVPTPQATSFKAGKAPRPLAAVRDAVLKDGKEGEFNGILCTLLGLTKNNERLPVRQTSVEEKDRVKVINVSLKTREDIILGYRAKDGSSAVLYRTDSTGALVKAVSYQKGAGGREIPLKDARAGFEAEAGFWVSRLDPDDGVASNP